MPYNFGPVDGVDGDADGDGIGDMAEVYGNIFEWRPHNLPREILALSPTGPVGSTLNSLGLPSLAFSFSGLVLGSVIYSLPFVVQPLQTSFVAVGRRPLEVAATLGAGPLDRFLNIVLPMSKLGYLTAIVLGFAHTMGEFGVVLMIGGNIPGQTQVLSIAIYDHVEALEYSQAHWLAGLLLLFSFLVLLTVYTLNKRASFLSGAGP